MYFITKSYLKNNHNHTAKQTLNDMMYTPSYKFVEKAKKSR